MKEVKPVGELNAIHTVQFPVFVLKRYVKLNDINEEIGINLKNHFGMNFLIQRFTTENNNFLFIFDKGTIVFSRAEFDSQTYTLQNLVVLFY